MTTVQLTLIIANMYIAASMAHENSRGAAFGIGLFWLLATVVVLLLTSFDYIK